MINVSVIGTDTVISNLKGLDAEMVRKVQRQVTISSARVLAEARRTAPKSTGNLTRSGRILVRDNEQIVEFNALYAWYAEHGRKPGKRPPLEPILDWVHKRGLGGTYSISSRRRTGNYQSQMKEDRAIAFLIQRAIGKNGTRPQPFLRLAFEREKPYFIQRMRDL